LRHQANSPDRWNIDLLYDENPGAIGRARTKWGGFIDASAI